MTQTPEIRYQLPTWKEALERVKTGEATALDRFIFIYEPQVSLGVGVNTWRNDLEAVIRELTALQPQTPDYRDLYLKALAVIERKKETIISLKKESARLQTIREAIGSPEEKDRTPLILWIHEPTGDFVATMGEVQISADSFEELLDLLQGINS